MKDLLKSYAIFAIMLTFPLIRHFTENSTVIALTELVVWSAVIILTAISTIFFAMSCVFYTQFDEMKINGIDNIEKIVKPFKSLRWWKSGINVAIVLGVLIYVQWTGPAILYVIGSVAMITGIQIFRAMILKVAKENGYDELEDEVDDKTDLKKSSLL